MKLHKKGQEGIPWMTVMIIVAVLFIIIGLFIVYGQGESLSNLGHKVTQASGTPGAP